MPVVPPRREAILAAAVLALLWAALAAIASWAIPQLDDWYQLDWLRDHDLTPLSFLRNAVHNWFHHNPRLGENALLLVNGSRLAQVVLTPTVEIALLVGVFALALGRWPRATWGDLQRLLLVQALIWMTAPSPGLLYFYRPFATNYVYGATLQLLVLLPYRLALTGAPRGPRHGLIPLMLVAGWLAGLCNEHTGPALLVAVVALTIGAGQRRRPWMLAGAAGVAIGVAMLIAAPGQKVRYAGLGEHVGVVEALRERGFTGAFDVLLGQLETLDSLILVAGLAILIAAVRAQRRGGALEGPSRGATVTLAALVAGAGAIIATLTASPLVGDRLYFAPSVLLVAAGLVVLERPLGDVVVRRLALAFAIVVLAVHLGVIGTVYRTANIEWHARDAELRATPSGQVGGIRELSYAGHTRWSLGDDLRTAYLREYVAQQIYGLPAIEYTEPSRLAEPSLPWQIELDVTYEPPLAQSEVMRRVGRPLPYLPRRPDRLVLLLRRLMPALRDQPGHRLVSIVAAVKGFDVPELAGRPLYAATWDGDEPRYVDAILDRSGALPRFVVWKQLVPDGATQAFVRACGRTQVIVPEPHAKGLALPFRLDCRGLYIAIVCTPDACWIAGAKPDPFPRAAR